MGGRWNPRGVAAVYLAESISLAALECLVHFDVATAPTDYVAVAVGFDEALVETVGARDLPEGWRDDPPVTSRAFGAQWIADQRSAVLQVPSVIVPLETNYVLNPSHPDFRGIEARDPIDFTFDARLLMA